MARSLTELWGWLEAEIRFLLGVGVDPGPWPPQTQPSPPQPAPPPPQPTPAPPPPTPQPAPTPPLPPTSGQIAWEDQTNTVDMMSLLGALNGQIPDIQALGWTHVQSWSNVEGQGQAVIRNAEPGDPDGAIAWHDDQGNIVVLADVAAQQGVSVSSAASHEYCEFVVDPTTNAVARAPNGNVWALEVCDPVESSSYHFNGVEVSDFVGPAFFGMGEGPLDKTGAVATPFSIAPGGYAVIDNQQVNAAGHPADAEIGHKPPRTRTPA